MHAYLVLPRRSLGLLILQGKRSVDEMHKPVCTYIRVHAVLPPLLYTTTCRSAPQRCKTSNPFGPLKARKQIWRMSFNGPNAFLQVLDDLKPSVCTKAYRQTAVHPRRALRLWRSRPLFPRLTPTLQTEINSLDVPSLSLMKSLSFIC